MMSGHEMADAAALGGCIEQQSVWANREEAVVLNDDRFSKKQSNQERHKAWAGEMNDVGFGNQACQPP
jgi:hypothetical protein